MVCQSKKHNIATVVQNYSTNHLIIDYCFQNFPAFGDLRISSRAKTLIYEKIPPKDDGKSHQSDKRRVKT